MMRRTEAPACAPCGGGIVTEQDCSDCSCTIDQCAIQCRFLHNYDLIEDEPPAWAIIPLDKLSEPQRKALEVVGRRDFPFQFSFGSGWYLAEKYRPYSQCKSCGRKGRMQYRHEKNGKTILRCLCESH